MAQCFRLVIGAVGAGLESITVLYDDLASRQPDDPPLLKIVQGDRDASTTHPKHQRQELVGERNLVTVQTARMPARPCLVRSLRLLDCNAGALRETRRSLNVRGRAVKGES